jgi:16S rRNA (guanine527-N7)-methyltransferase
VARASSSPEAAPALAAGEILAGACQLGLNLDVRQADLLSRFAALLVRWNSVHNLTAVDAPLQILSHHLLDSLAILQPLGRIFWQRAAGVLDIGSGGGLPGIPLAIARPDWRVTLVDKVQKKVAFLTQVKVELGLANVQCIHGRAEELKLEPVELIVSRAFASLAEFVRVSRHLLAPGGWWGAMKGVAPLGEIEELRRAYPEVRVADIVKLDVPRLGAERHLILLQRT